VSTMRVGIVGLGVISRFYLAAVDATPSLRLAAVCDLRAAALDPHRRRAACYEDHRAMLRVEQLDALIVTVPNDVHARVCGDALEAGVAVCVEKPLATTLADGRALIETSRAVGVPLFTAFHRRYNAPVLELLRTAAGRPPIESLTVRYLERIEDHVGGDRWYLDPRRCGGGCVADNGPNAFDVAAMFLGDLNLLHCAIARDEQGIDRSASIALAGAGGARATVELDWSYDGECKDVELRFADGSSQRADMLAGYPGFKDSLWHEYAGILAEFSRTIRAPLRDGDGGLAALSLVDGVYRAERAATAAGGGAA
jgi:predicted dehydrogenase